MKNLLVILVLLAIGYFAWQKFAGGGPPEPIKDPVYGEVRVTSSIQGRELEMALFIRAASDADCRGRAEISWQKALEGCPGCSMQPVKCQDELPARYARLFDDVPIPSAYLSATAGTAGERDGRIVVYGLTDAEGVQMCEIIRTKLNEKYHGATHCVAPSGQ